MSVVFTPMPVFTKPGPLRDLLDERGLQGEWVFSRRPQRSGGISKEEAVAGVMERAPEMEYFLADTTPLTRDFFNAAKQLKLVAMFGVGLDHIDLQAATDNGVLVTNAPGGNTRCVAELAFWFMLDLAHKATQMHMDMARGEWRRRMGTEISGKTLGVVGLGHIGQDVARLGKAFGMNVIVANRTPRPEIAEELGVLQVSFDEVLERADFLSLHIPGGPGSWRFGAQEFFRMKPGAFFINTARGDLADLDALADAIEAKRISGAGLDVFSEEPMDLTHRLFSMPQVVATPHAGAMSREAMARVMISALDEVVNIRNAKRSANARNVAVYSMQGWEGFK